MYLSFLVPLILFTKQNTTAFSKQYIVVNIRYLVRINFKPIFSGITIRAWHSIHDVSSCIPYQLVLNLDCIIFSLSNIEYY